MAEDNGDFGQLAPRVQRAVDAVFDAASGRACPGRRERARPSPRKRRRLDDSGSAASAGGFVADDPPMGGGFILDDAPASGGFLVDDAPTAGGFLADDIPAASAAGGFINELPTGGGFVVADDDDEAPTHIALDRIPGALQALDLSPDDADVLAIFHNAASGWGAGAAGSGSPGVARKDWRAVCAVLLAGRPEEAFPETAPGSDEDADEDDEAAGADEGDEYMDEDDESDSELSAVPSDYEDEDYGAASTRGRKPTKGKKKKGAAEAAAVSDGAAQLTARQKRENRATFALFFPDVPDERLDAQRIRIKDIMRVSDLLKEKITAEEIIEMLQEFSTAPDKSMGLADFEQVLVLAQLV